MPAGISTPPPSRVFSSSCSYWPRERKPCGRTGGVFVPVFSVIQALYLSLSVPHIYPLPSSFGLPTGIAGMVTPSRISHHLGISNEYGISTLPSVSLTSRDSSRWYAFFADSTLRSEPHSISLMASHTPSSVRKDGAILARAPRIRTSV